ncbi:MAG: PmoA family protein [Cyclobacteriaceae bacterium]|nr:PmoA family protein [Cyclobacteriaceae bacterium]
MKVFFALCLACFSLLANGQSGFTFRESPEKKKFEIFYNKKLITSYCYFDSTEKPVLFPIKTLSGITITRGYPISPRPGERTDHPHHVGLWLNYESVNGLDFWNNSSAIAAEKKSMYGSIKHVKIISGGNDKGNSLSLITKSNWVNQAGEVLLEETTYFTFSELNGDLLIDRTSTLTAKVPEVIFKDVKDGLLGLRVARELEMPSKQEDNFVDANGIVTKVPMTSNAGVTGLYVNREGITGDDTWSKRSSWTCLNGEKDGSKISIAIIDHPGNIGAPTYWHARGYGLFAANPLGRKIFSQGKEELNLTLKKKQSATFRYRVVIHEGKAFLDHDQIDGLMNLFALTK